MAADEAWSITTTGHAVSWFQIERFTDAIGDHNPLFADDEVARASGHPARLAPPTMIDSFNPFYAGTELPVAQEYPYEFSGGDRYVLHAPVAAGHVVDVHTRIGTIHDRVRRDGSSRIRLVEYVKDYHEAETGRALATVTWTYANFEGVPTASSPGPYEVPRDGWDEIEPFTDELDRVKIAKWAGAVGDYARLHIDYPYVTRERDLDDVVGHGPRTTAMLARVMTDWLGAAGQLLELDVRYRANSYPGDVLTAHGWVRPGNDGTHEAILAVVNQDGIAVTTGTARARRD